MEITPDPVPGTLYLKKGIPNPAGMADACLFLVAGDPVSASVREIIPEEGIEFPDAGNGAKKRKSFEMRKPFWKRSMLF